MPRQRRLSSLSPNFVEQKQFNYNNNRHDFLHHQFYREPHLMDTNFSLNQSPSNLSYTCLKSSCSTPSSSCSRTSTFSTTINTTLCEGSSCNELFNDTQETQDCQVSSTTSNHYLNYEMQR